MKRFLYLLLAVLVVSGCARTKTVPVPVLVPCPSILPIIDCPEAGYPEDSFLSPEILQAQRDRARLNHRRCLARNELIESEHERCVARAKED